MKVIFESVSLHVADVEKSVNFYSKIPGAELVMHRPGQFAKFKLAGEKGFHVELDAPDLQALHDELKAAGIEPDGPPEKQFFGRVQFHVRDPDGNVLEFDTP
jgi:catechol 2,3-dioxygenase-like lactoylglutathione lyase family enzyme